MRPGTATTLLFVFYCIEVGVFLVAAPWTPTWDRLVIALPFPLLHSIYLDSAFRGAVSGFGTIHLLWGAHDLEQWLAQREERARSEATREGCR